MNYEFIPYIGLEITLCPYFLLKISLLYPSNIDRWHGQSYVSYSYILIKNERLAKTRDRMGKNNAGIFEYCQKDFWYIKRKIS